MAEIATATAVGASVVPATVTVHLLSRARLASLVGKDRVLRKGKRLAVAEGEVTQPVPAAALVGVGEECLERHGDSHAGATAVEALRKARRSMGWLARKLAGHVTAS